VKKIKEQRGAVGEMYGVETGRGGGALAGAEPGLRCCRGDFLEFSRSLAGAGGLVGLAAFG
jgi:hypothetical protein